MGIEQIRQLKAQALIPKAQKVHTIAKVSKKRQAKNEEEKKLRGDNGLDAWFEERRLEMTGRCALCGGKTEKFNDETFRNSIHHLLDKKPTLFPSVATHPDNWLEVCFYGNSCHQNIHNRTISWELLHDSAEWEIIADKFKRIYPFIAETERRNIHELLLKEVR